MGDVSSKPITTDPSSNSPQTHEPNSQTDQTNIAKPEEVEAPATNLSDLPKEEPPADLEIKEEEAVSVKGEEEEEEEEGECGFCLYMKGGGCKDAFVEWENCVKEIEEKGEDIVENCLQISLDLKKCIEAHRDYYGVILLAEKAVEEEIKRKLEAEKAKEAGIDELKEEKGKGEGIDEEKQRNSIGYDTQGELNDDKQEGKDELEEEKKTGKDLKTETEGADNLEEEKGTDD